MGEERLIEITKEICMSSDPIWTMGYISSLGESDIYLLFKYIKSSKHYGGSNIYDVIYNFACDYLVSKDIPLPVNDVVLFPSNGFSDNMNSLDYFSCMMDDSMKFIGTGKSK